MPSKHIKPLFNLMISSLLFFSITSQGLACDTLFNHLYYRLLPGYTIYADGSVCSCDYSHTFCPKCDLDHHSPGYDNIEAPEREPLSYANMIHHIVRLLCPSIFGSPSKCNCASAFGHYTFCPTCDLELDPI